MKLPPDHFRQFGIVNRWIGAHANNYNVGRQGRKPRAIVVHIMAGTLAGTDATFNTQRPIKSSTHYGIGRPWEHRKDERAPLVIHQYVRESDTALHAGTDPARIASGELKPPTWPLWTPRTNPNLHTIGIEMEGVHTTPWTDRMYHPISVLIADICKRYQIPVNPVTIIGHREIDPSRRSNCPGLCNLSALRDRIGTLMDRTT